MIAHLMASVGVLAPARAAVVVGPAMDEVAAAVVPVPVVVQPARRGTADAVKVARDALDGFAGTVLILYGDTPLITPATLRAMQARREAGAGVVVLGFRPADPADYGRLITGAEGALQRIVEARDATTAEREIALCNSGVMAVDAAHLFALVHRIGDDNAKGEYYLTDIVALARDDGLDCAVVEGAAGELLGINTRADLAAAEAIVQAGLRAGAMAAGATLVDPASVWLSFDTTLGRDVVVGPNVVFGPGVVVGEGAEVRAFSHLEGAIVAAGAIVGPFARLRPGADIGAGARVGNFVEVKSATLAAGAKANHLAYLGDAAIGEGANIGAGTITCNYDGFDKHRTTIGAGAFIGSNTALVAPVTVGAGAIVAAGSTIGRDVADDALAIERAETVEKPGWAARFRALRQARATKAATRRAAGDVRHHWHSGPGRGGAAAARRAPAAGVPRPTIRPAWPPWSMAGSNAAAPRASSSNWRQCSTASRSPAPSVSAIPAGRPMARRQTNNAHPHATARVAVVHNGIIENFQALRGELEAAGEVLRATPTPRSSPR